MKLVNEQRTREILFTPELLLWLCRMAIGEGGKKCSRQHFNYMLITLINRFFFIPYKWPKNFLTFVRSFSQPINPKWQEGGILAKKYKSRKEGSIAKLNRRKRICNLQWKDIPQSLFDEVLTFAGGHISKLYIPNIFELVYIVPTNWGSQKNIDKKFPGGLWFEGNYFIEESNRIFCRLEYEL